MRLDLRLRVNRAADLHVVILGQLAPAQLPRGDALEPGPLEIVRPRRTAQGSAAEVVGVGTRAARSGPGRGIRGSSSSSRSHSITGAGLKPGSGGFAQLLRRRTPKFR